LKFSLLLNPCSYKIFEQKYGKSPAYFTVM